MKKLLDKFRKKKLTAEEITEHSFNNETFNALHFQNFIDSIGLNGHEVPTNRRDIGFQSEGVVSEYPYRTFILEFGNATLSTGSLDSMYYGGNINTTFYLTKLTKSQSVKIYRNAITDEGTRYINMVKSGNSIEADEALKSIELAKILLDEISDGFNDGFLGTATVTIFANDERILDNLSMIMQDDLLGSDHHLRVLYNRQRDGYLATLPIGNNNLTQRNDRRFFDRTALVAASPFYSSKLPFSGGVPCGVNQHTNTMEFLNVFARFLDNYSSLIVGLSGSGKSFACKYISASQVLLGYRLFSVDIDGEYGPICRLIGGTEVEIREGGTVCLNVCAISEEEIEQTLPSGRRVSKVVVPIGTKIGQLLKFYSKLCKGGLSSEEMAILKLAIQETIESFGITSDPASLYTDEKVAYKNTVTDEIDYRKKRKPEFTLLDIFHRLLINCTKNPDLETLKYEEMTDLYAERLIRVLRGYTRYSPDGKLLDGQNNFGNEDSVDNLLDSIKWINFNLKAIEGSDIFDIMMYVVMNLAWEYFIKRPSLRKYRKRVKLEEGWRMKRIDGGMAFVEDCARRSRKYNGGIDVITQDLTPFLDDPDGIALVKNATTGLFLRIGSISYDEKEKLKSIFNFSDGELDVICRRPPTSENDNSKGEGILRVGGASAHIKVTVSDEIKAFIDTDPEYLSQSGLYNYFDDSEFEEGEVS